MGLGDSIKRLSQSLGFGKAEDASEEKPGLDISRLQESDSESEIDQDQGNDSESEEEIEEEDMPLSEAELDDDADVVPFQKVTINNRPALKQALKSIELPAEAKTNFIEHMTITADSAVVLKDIYDDTERELAFYKQALEAASSGRKKFKKLKLPFSRPEDYFAEMVKSDEHMEKLKQKLITEETAKKASQEARRQRELKKFGKKVQHAKLQERQKEKRDTLDKIKNLKRKRANDDVSTDQFDVEIEDALRDKKQERDSKFKLGNTKRQAKNQKYGFGGKKSGSKRNTSESTMDISSFQHSRKQSRPGKSRRHK